MRAYVAVFSARFRALLQYRAAALAGLATQIFWGFIRMMIFTAFYQSTDAPQPMSLEEVITYVWLTQALLMLLPWRPDPDVRDLVRSGNVAYELIRPIDLYNLWYARSVAQRLAPAVLRCLPMLVLAGLFFGLGAPAGVLPAAAFALSVVAALALSAAITTLLTVSLMFTTEGRGVQALSTSLVNIFSGSIIPLPLFPDWFQPIAAALPFRGLIDTPFRLYLGHLPPDAVWSAVGHQVLWTALIVLAGRALLGLASRRLVVQGG